MPSARRWTPFLVAACAPLFAGESATAQQLLRNIRGLTTDPGSFAADFTSTGAEAFFVAYTQQWGVELWKTDGSAAGTAMVADIHAGRAGFTSSSAGFTSARLAAVGARLFCVGVDGTTFGPELIVSDGTASGTFVVKHINPTGQSFVSALTPLGNDVVFAAHDGVTGSELWFSDGTAAGTRLVRDIEPGAAGSLNVLGLEMYPAHGDVYLPAATSDFGRELWVTDGTTAGTRMLGDIWPGTLSSSPRDVVPLPTGDVLFSAAAPGEGRELWRADPAAGRVERVAELMPGAGSADPSELIRYRARVFFAALSPTGVREVWHSDGTAVGTALLADGVGTDPRSFTVAGGLLYFSATTPAAGRELWRTDGTISGTFMVADLFPGTMGSIPILTEMQPVSGDAIVFIAVDPIGRSLWYTDGTPGGTRRLLSSPVLYDLAAVGGGRVVFTADDGQSGDEPWITDGTVAGTRLLLNINPAVEGSSAPRVFTPSGDLVYFVATDTATGADVYRTDGTEAGTILLHDLPAAVQGDPQFLTDVGGRLFFRSGLQLWTSDGTPQGTVGGPVFPGSVGLNGIAGLDSRALIAARAGLLEQLYITDGTVAGTSLVKRVNPTGSAQIREMTSHRGLVYFAGTETSIGSELWRSDGTAAGTRPVQDIQPGIGSAFPTQITPSGDLLYFVADNGVAGRELWVTDGTEAGTQMLRDIGPGAAWGDVRELAPMSANRLLFVADDGVSGAEPWVTDGTPAGTVPLGDLVPGGDSSDVTDFGAAADVAYFAATTPAVGREPWITDGTPAGTRLLLDIVPGAGGSDPSGFQAAGSSRHAVFAATTAVGTELWSTDGTAAGTGLLADLDPGAGSSAPAEFTRLGTRLVFAARSQAVGRELFEVGLGPIGAALLESYGVGCATGSPPTLTGNGVPRLGASLGLEVGSTPANAPVLLLLGSGRAAIAIGGCQLWLQPVAALNGTASGAGRASFPIAIPASPALLGVEVAAQAVVGRAGGAFAGVADVTAGLAIVAGR